MIPKARKAASTAVLLETTTFDFWSSKAHVKACSTLHSDFVHTHSRFRLKLAHCSPLSPPPPDDSPLPPLTYRPQVLEVVAVDSSLVQRGPAAEVWPKAWPIVYSHAIHICSSVRSSFTHHHIWSSFHSFTHHIWSSVHSFTHHMWSSFHSFTHHIWSSVHSFSPPHLVILPFIHATTFGHLSIHSRVLSRSSTTTTSYKQPRVYYLVSSPLTRARLF